LVIAAPLPLLHKLRPHPTRRAMIAQWPAAALFLLPLGAVPAAAQSVPASFTAEQAARGETAYQRNCQDCHGANLDDGEFGGAPLKGSYFAQHWGGGTAYALVGYMKIKMPPDRPGQLSPGTYADLAAYILSRNGYAPGAAELPLEDSGQQTMSLKK
jgi:mono/diheme cytochrome c family protein